MHPLLVKLDQNNLHFSILLQHSTDQQDERDETGKMASLQKYPTQTLSGCQNAGMSKNWRGCGGVGGGGS